MMKSRSRCSMLFLNVPGHPSDVLTVFPPVGVLSMCAVLKRHGYGCSFIDADINRLGPEDVVRQVEDHAPALVGISLNVAQVKHAVPYVAALRRVCAEIPLVLGGPYVSAVKENIFLDFTNVDYAVVNEGEFAATNLVGHLNGEVGLSDVPNLIYRAATGSVSRTNISRILDLDSLPLPDYSLVRPFLHKYPGAFPSIAHPSVALIASRGCPFNCTFCSSPATWGRKTVFRKVDSVVSEVLYLADSLGVREVFIQDDTLNTRMDWFLSLCERIMQVGLNRRVHFKCQFRADEALVTREVLEHAKRANFWMIFYGVESGSQDMLDRMNKNIRRDQIIRAFHLTHEAGLCTYASMMIGNMGETAETVRDSERLLEIIRPDFGGFAIATPFPGTRLHMEAVKHGFITLTDFRNYQFGECILRTEGLTTEEITRLCQAANEHFPYYYRSERLERSDVSVRLRVLGRLPESVAHSTIFSIRVRLYNRSTHPLVFRPPHPVSLSYHWTRSNGDYEVFDGLRTPIHVPLAPRENREFGVDVLAPTKPGSYCLEITLVQEMNLWFEEACSELPVRLHITAT